MTASASRNIHEIRASRVLDVAMGLARKELPFAASLAQLALQSQDVAEMRSLVGQIYALALEDDCLYLAELADEALCHLENSQAS